MVDKSPCPHPELAPPQYAPYLWGHGYDCTDEQAILLCVVLPSIRESILRKIRRSNNLTSVAALVRCYELYQWAPQFQPSHATNRSEVNSLYSLLTQEGFQGKSNDISCHYTAYTHETIQKELAKCEAEPPVASFLRGAQKVPRKNLNIARVTRDYETELELVNQRVRNLLQERPDFYTPNRSRGEQRNALHDRLLREGYPPRFTFAQLDAALDSRRSPSPRRPPTFVSVLRAPGAVALASPAPAPSAPPVQASPVLPLSATLAPAPSAPGQLHPVSTPPARPQCTGQKRRRTVEFPPPLTVDAILRFMALPLSPNEERFDPARALALMRQYAPLCTELQAYKLVESINGIRSVVGARSEREKAMFLTKLEKDSSQLNVANYIAAHVRFQECLELLNGTEHEDAQAILHQLKEDGLWEIAALHFIRWMRVAQRAGGRPVPAPLVSAAKRPPQRACRVTTRAAPSSGRLPPAPGASPPPVEPSGSLGAQEPNDVPFTDEEIDAMLGDLT